MKKVIFCLLAMFFSLETNAQGTQEYSDPHQLIDVVVQKAVKNDDKKRESVRFTKTYRVYDLDNTGNPKPEKIGNREVTYEGQGRKTEPPPIDINRVLATNYYFRFDDIKIQQLKDEDGNLVCTSCYVIHFWPKNNLPEGENGYYQAANRLTGVVYIDKEHLYLRRMEANMNKSFSVAWILAEVKKAKILFEQELRHDLDNIVIIRHFTVTSIRYRKFFTEKFERHSYTYTDYELVK